MNTKKYSVAICPPQEFTDQIKAMKRELEDRIGKFHSRNSEAHITFNVFTASEEQITEWKKYMEEFCSRMISFEVRLVKTGSYPNGAFYLSAYDQSRDKLISVMQQFHQEAPVKLETESVDPYMSIARRLKRDQLAAADELFGNKIFELKFNCDNLAIRQFDSKIRQYFVESRFWFRDAAKIPRS